jgi:hypothetical protein
MSPRPATVRNIATSHRLRPPEVRPCRELHIYHGGHLALATDAQHLAPVVDAFLTAGTAEDTGPAREEARRRTDGRDARAASGSLTPDHRITRGTLPACARATCTDGTGQRTDGTRGAGIIRRPGPRLGPHPRPCALAILLLNVLTGHLRAWCPAARWHRP